MRIQAAKRTSEGGTNFPSFNRRVWMYPGIPWFFGGKKVICFRFSEFFCWKALDFFRILRTESKDRRNRVLFSLKLTVCTRRIDGWKTTLASCFQVQVGMGRNNLCRSTDLAFSKLWRKKTPFFHRNYLFWWFQSI